MNAPWHDENEQAVEGAVFSDSSSKFTGLAEAYQITVMEP